MMAGERLSAKKGVAQPARGLLHDVKNLRCIVALGVVLDDVSLFGGDDHANLIGAGGDHPLHQVFRNRFRTLHAVYQPRPDRQQLLGAAQRLYALPRPRRRNDADHCATSVCTDSFFTEKASSRYLSNCPARTFPVCSSRVRCRAWRAMDCKSLLGVCSALSTSSPRLTTSRSCCGSKNESSPSHESVINGVPQAAASKKRPEGHQPYAAISLRVRLRVIREDE